MRILAIESSCDETALAVVRDGRILEANLVASQADLHALYGGVVPEIASREHIKAIVPLLTLLLNPNASLDGLSSSKTSYSRFLSEDLQALAKTPQDFMNLIDAIAVTQGPGLVGSLLVGLSAAKALSRVFQKPLYPIHHIQAHIAANCIAFQDFEPPFVALVVSGGHSHLIYCSEDWSMQILGRTRDDAAGEAFDKVARALNLGYPGGPKVDARAKFGNPKAIRFPVAKLDNPLDFSFSGLKTSALNYINMCKSQAKVKNEDWETLINIDDFCASYQENIVSVLVKHTSAAMRFVNETMSVPCNRIALAGGVAANSSLRLALESMAKEEGYDFYCPPKSLCTDNAAMIGAMAYFAVKAGLQPADSYLNARATWSIEDALAGL